MKETDFEQMTQVYGTIVASLMIIMIFGVLRPTVFPTLKSFINISRQMVTLTIISIGVAMVVVANEFDPSMGSMVSLRGVMTVLMAVVGIPVGTSFLLTVLACMATGWVDGYIVARFRVLSSIITLGANTVLDGLTYGLTDGVTVFENIPKSFIWLGTLKIGGIPFFSVLMILFVLAFAFLMKYTPSDRKVYVIDGEEGASKVVGINVRTHKILAPTLRRVLAGGTGIVVALRVGPANIPAGARYLLQSYAAAYIGRTVSRQGISNVAGVFVGAIILPVLANRLTILQIPSYMQNIITGITTAVVVIAKRLRRGDAK